MRRNQLPEIGISVLSISYRRQALIRLVLDFKSASLGCAKEGALDLADRRAGEAPRSRSRPTNANAPDQG